MNWLAASVGTVSATAVNGVGVDSRRQLWIVESRCWPGPGPVAEDGRLAC